MTQMSIIPSCICFVQTKKFSTNVRIFILFFLTCISTNFGLVKLWKLWFCTELFLHCLNTSLTFRNFFGFQDEMSFMFLDCQKFFQKRLFFFRPHSKIKHMIDGWKNVRFCKTKSFGKKHDVQWNYQSQM